MKTNSNKNIMNLLAFIALAIAGLLIFITKLLPVCGVTIGGPIISVLEIIKELLILLVVAVSAYKFVERKTKVWKIIYWVAIAIFIAGIIMIWFFYN